MVNCVDGPTVATLSCMMEKRRRQSTLWTLFCLLAAQVSFQPHCLSHTHIHKEFSVKSATVTTLELSLTDWQSEFGGYTCYVANEEDEEVSVITV